MMEKPAQLRTMPEGQLQQQLAQVREELAALRFKAKQGTVEQPHRIRQMKRDIARMLTVLRERQDQRSATSHQQPAVTRQGS